MMRAVRSRLLPCAAALFMAGLAAPALAQSADSQPGIPVQGEAARRQDMPVTLRNIGAVQSYQSVLVRARVDGTLDKVLFTEGQDVKAGDKLVLIDPRPYAAALAQAQAKKAADEAMLSNAQRDLGRYSSLARSDFASRQQLDTQTATVAQSVATIAGDDAAVVTAKLNLEFCTIVSPIDGRAGLRLVDAGNLIHAADATGIVTINQIHPIAVIFTLPQDALPQVQAAMARGPVAVRALSSDDRTSLADGKLLTFDNAIDATTGTIKLKAEFANEANTLWPGQFVNVRVQVDVLHDTVTVPSVAVQRGPNGLYVYVVKPDGTAAMQPVDVRQDDGTIAAIAKGLDAGVMVVTNGMSRLQQGTHVTVAPASAS
jgi:multidrug efflux system membrane fusion protein